MKYVPDRTGRFVTRPHYEPRELDGECEAIIVNFLRRRYGEVRFPTPTDDLTMLLEKEVADLDMYADLSEFGENVEGVTIFNPEGKPSVRISGALANDSRRENRLRTTLTHEFGHVHFHAYLWNPVAMELDFGDAVGRSRMPDDSHQTCKRQSIIDAPVADWMEWQAGHVCGAILMPAEHVKRMLQERFQEEIDASVVTVHSHLGARLIEAITQAYAVSQDAARVRLLRLGLIQEESRNVPIFPC
jgi:hypothetical protein